MKDGHLEAKDLMIGDWVFGLSNSPRRVQGVRDYNYENVVVADHWVNCNNIKPILLTPEILEKNGLYKITYPHKDWYDYIDTPFYVELVKTDTYFYSYTYNDDCYCVLACMYVHELQHALRLCGLTELADNFKV